MTSLSSDTREVVAFGISGVPERDLQDCIELLLAKLPKPIEFLDFQEINLPDFKLRANELAHSRGLLNMIHLNTVDINFVKPSQDSVISLECIDRFSESYKKHPVAVLLKALLQFGYCVMLSISIPKEFTISELAPLTHPFTNRRQFFSSVEIKRFVISHEDMLEIASVSEDKESEADDYWKEYATYLPPPLILSNKASEKYFNKIAALPISSTSSNERKGKLKV
jgi:hypothetical protein